MLTSDMAALSLKDIIIDSECQENDPCEHHVEVRKLEIDEDMDGRSIYLLFVNNNLQVPKHFQQYDDPDYE